MKKVMSAVLALALALSLTACGGQQNSGEPQNSGDAAQEEPNAQIANPFVDYDTLEDAEHAAGYSYAVPEVVEGYDAAAFRVMNGGELLEVIYRSADDELTARKAPGDGDISGDYTAYKVEAIADKAELPSVTFKGDGDSVMEMVHLALWTDTERGFTYSLMSRAGMEQGVFSSLVDEIQRGEAADGFADELVTGGWSVNGGDLSLDANPDAKAALEKAVDGLTGYAYEPIAMLGSQVVAGTNYAILCRGTVVVPDAVPTYEIAIVYEDLDGNAEITDTVPLPGLPASAETVPGGWMINTGEISVDANPDVRTALERALEGQEGAEYEAVAYLSSQVVAGMNYLLFCRVTPVVPDAVPTFAVVKVYADLDDTAEITDVTEVNL